ncbi:MAG: membrane assembly protein AsmA [Sphingobacteriaceae bacterium]|nr:membrane assembly protein AsmA [Sphingobacteriaceae bacterium]
MNKPKKSLFKRILKWSGITFLLLLILIIIAPFIFKDKIIALVKDEANNALNAKVDFGEFDLSLISTFPDFRFEINKVSVVGVDDFANDTLASINQLRLDLNLKSVISGGPYSINSIVINKARILGKVLSNGKANWDIAKADSSAAAPEETSSEETKFSLKLKEFKIENAHIVYDDQQGGMYSKLEDLNYSLNGDFTQDNFVLSNLLEIAKTTFAMGGVNYLTEVKTRVKADLDMDMPKMKFAFKENEFSLNELTLGLDGYVEMPDTNITMDLKFKANKADFKSILSLIPAVFTKDFAGLQASGKMALDGNAKGVYNASSLPAFGVNLLVENGMFKYPALPKSVNNVNIDIKVLNPNGQLDATTIDVSKFHVEMAGNPIDLAAHVKTPISDPGLRADIQGKIDLASVKEFIPLEKGDNLNGIIKSDISIAGNLSAIEKQDYEKFKASGGLEISNMDYSSTTLPYAVQLKNMILNFSTQYVELAAFDAKLGKSDIMANGKIENFMQFIFKDDLITGHFNVNSNLMDLNEMMGSSETTTTAASTETAVATATTEAEVMHVPGNIDFVMNTNVKKVLYTNLVLENMVGNIEVKNKKVDMTNLRMNVMDGALTINGFYETSNPTKPTTGLTLKIENFDIQKTYNSFDVLKTMAPSAQYAKGKFTATLENFNTSLNSKMEPDLNAVKANGTLKTDKVVVGGFPPFMKLSEVLKMEQLKSMNVDNLNLNYLIEGGRLIMKPFDTKINNIPTNISGSTGFDQTIDYKWKMQIPKSMMGGAAAGVMDDLLKKANAQAGTNLAVGDKINVTANFGGTVTKPTVSTGLKDDAKSTVATVTTQVVNNAIDKAAEEAKKILEDAKAECEKQKAEAAANAEKTKQDGYAAADALVEQASNPIAKVAAKKAAEKAKQEADKKVQKIIDDAEAKCKKQLEEAQIKADAKAAEKKK